MLRLLLSLICGLAIAGTLLLMRQQRVELGHECNTLHDEMLDIQKQLWSQQLQIASAVSPGTLRAVLAEHELRGAQDGAEGASPTDAEAAGDWRVLLD